MREPPDESSVPRVRVPLAKPRICGATCPSDHPVVQLRENARVQLGRCGFDSHQECQFRRAVEFGLSATVLTDQRVQIPPQPPYGWVPKSLLARRFLYRAESRRSSNPKVECRPLSRKLQVQILRPTQSLARVSCCAHQQFRRVAGLGYRSISARSPVRVRPPATNAGVVQG